MVSGCQAGLFCRSEDSREGKGDAQAPQVSRVFWREWCSAGGGVPVSAPGTAKSCIRASAVKNSAIRHCGYSEPRCCQPLLNPVHSPVDGRPRFFCSLLPSGLAAQRSVIVAPVRSGNPRSMRQEASARLVLQKCERFHCLFREPIHVARQSPASVRLRARRWRVVLH